MKIFNYIVLTVLMFFVSCTKTDKDVVGDSSIVLYLLYVVRGDIGLANKA